MIAVTLLTGFLGSGKTSLLRRLLRLPDLKDTAVLINEFGEVGLDHLLIERVDDDIVLLQSGCVCCTIRGDLKEAILRLHDRAAQGEIPRFDRLVIETTGLADPAPIVATLKADTVLRHHFRLASIITVVDGLCGAMTLAEHAESRHQAAVADRLVISKADLAAPEEIETLKRDLARLNPTADILALTEGDETPPGLIADGVHQGIGRIFTQSRIHAGHAHGDIRSFSLIADDPIDWAGFGLWLSMLLNRHGKAILRVKGILDVYGVATPVVIHGVQHIIHDPVHLPAWPDGDRRSRIVVIAEDLDAGAVTRSFKAFTRLAIDRRDPVRFSA